MHIPLKVELGHAGGVLFDTRFLGQHALQFSNVISTDCLPWNRGNSTLLQTSLVQNVLKHPLHYTLLLRAGVSIASHEVALY